MTVTVVVRAFGWFVCVFWWFVRAQASTIALTATARFPTTTLPEPAVGSTGMPTTSTTCACSTTGCIGMASTRTGVTTIIGAAWVAAADTTGIAGTQQPTAQHACQKIAGHLRKNENE